MLKRPILCVWWVLSCLPLLGLVALWRHTPCLVSLSWDPAAHALDGLKLYHSLTTFSPVSFLLHLVSMVWWPPLPPLLMVPLYALFPMEVAPVVLSALAMVATLGIAATFLSAWPAILTAWSLILSSWIFWKFSLYPMYEVPGAALTLLAVACYWRALAKRDERSYRHFAWALLALLLMKWNFGIQLGVVMVAAEAWLAPRALVLARWRKLAAWRDFPALNALIVALFVLILYVRRSGGGQFVLGGARVSLTEIANPLLLFSWLVALRYALGLRRHRSDLVALPVPLATLRRHFLLPYAAWLLFPFPNRFQVLLRHLHGTGGGAQLNAARFHYYWQYLESVYLASAAQVALATVGLVAALVLAWRKRERGALMAIAFFSFALFSTWFLSSTSDDRLLINFFPVLALIVGWAVGQLRRGWILAIVFLALPLARRDFFAARVARFHQDGDGICFFDERLVRDLRAQVIAVADRDARPVMSVGLSSDLDLLCPMLELEFYRHHPAFARVPGPPICDYGYRRGALDVAREGKVQAVVLFDKALPEVTAVRQWLETAPVVEVSPFRLEGTPYTGKVYRLR